MHSRLLYNWKAGVALGALALLSACGGGGGNVSRLPTPAPAPSPAPAPTPTPTPTPAPTPTPTPAANFNTAEVNRSDGPEYHNAITAWTQGITGQGASIAIVDTGIDIDSPEFAGRILPESRDVSSQRGIDAVDDHGTNVALVAAGALDNEGAVGIAYGASLLVYRADENGTCTGATSLDGCQFSDNAIARGIEEALRANATVINLSLGGGAPSQRVLDAIQQATQAGIVVVVAAGNDGDSTDPGIDPDNPDPFAISALSQGNGAVIIVGSVDQNGDASSFSNRAGNSADSYLMARGQGICCVYEDGQIKVTQQGGQSFVTLFSGTSFAAPQVAGAVALLAQAFPNLTGQEIVEILLDTARDAGMVGTDTTYGRGIMDLADAFQPQGTTRMPGTQGALALADDVAIASAPMGDAFSGASLQGIVLDKYDRAYSYEMASRTRMATDELLLTNSARTGLRNVSLGSPNMAVAFTLDQRGQMTGDSPLTPLQLSRAESDAAQVLAARVALKISPDTQIGIGFAESADGLAVQLQGRERPAFMLTRSAAGELGFTHRNGESAALRRDVGPFGVTMLASRGEVMSGAMRSARDMIGDQRESFAFTRFGIVADRRFGALSLTLGSEMLNEERTVLGAYLHESFGGRGAQSVFVDGTAALDLGDGWRVGAEGRMGMTRALSGGLIAEGSRFRSVGYSMDVGKRGVLQDADRLGFRLSSPLRVTSGGLNFDLPVSYDYGTESAEFALRRVSLAPDGHEMMGELAWRGRALDSMLAASVFYRSEPGHVANAPDDRGVLLRWSRGF